MPVRARFLRRGKRTNGIGLRPEPHGRRGPCPQRLKRRMRAQPCRRADVHGRKDQCHTRPARPLKEVPDNSSLHDVSEQAPRPWRARCNWIIRQAFLASFSVAEPREAAGRSVVEPTRMRAGARAPSTCKPKNRLASPERSDGGARRDRTDDLLLAKQALSQLSYGPARKSQPAGA